MQKRKWEGNQNDTVQKNQLNTKVSSNGRHEEQSIYDI